jgi:Outer membrane lipoprotein-sorting protein
MSKNIRLFLLILLLVTVFFPGKILAASPEQRAALLQKKYQQLHSITFDFSQTTHNSDRIKHGAGNAVFLRLAVSDTKDGSPGIMRWNYTHPTEQTIINDGMSLSIYTSEDKQLLVSSAQDMESDIIYAIFAGTKNLLDEFAVAPKDPLFLLNDPPEGCETLQLVPKKPHSQIKRVQVWMTGDRTIRRLLMEDHFGALTELTFANVRFNTLHQKDPQQIEALRALDLLPGTEIIRP